MTEMDIRNTYLSRGIDPEPYIKKRRKAYAYKEKYYKDRCLCPCCGSSDYSVSYLGFILDVENFINYKDENKVNCKCKWVGIVHDLAKKEDFLLLSKEETLILWKTLSKCKSINKSVINKIKNFLHDSQNQ